jgi:hypothetical protein
MASWFILNFGIIAKKMLQLSCILYVYTVSDYQCKEVIEQIILTVFCLIITSWSLFSYKMVETSSMIKFSLYLLIPTLISIEILEGYRYYYLTYIEILPFSSYGNNFIQKHSSVFLLLSSFIYFTSSVIKLKQINIQNKVLVLLKDFAQKTIEVQGTNPAFERLAIFIYESYFKYFQYAMLLITIMTSMIEVNFVNFLLILFCIGVISRQKSTSSTLWVYYVFFTDLCILVK